MKQHTGTYPIHLFDEHFVQKWVEPLLKTTVVVVRHDQVADAVVAFHAQVLPSAHVPESCNQLEAHRVWQQGSVKWLGRRARAHRKEKSPT